jgi:hypothetical protein
MPVDIVLGVAISAIRQKRVGRLVSLPRIQMDQHDRGRQVAREVQRIRGGVEKHPGRSGEVTGLSHEALVVQVSEVALDFVEQPLCHSRDSSVRL